MTPAEASLIIRDQRASIINHPFNAMALDFFHFKALIDLFDLTEDLTEEKAESLLKDMNDYLLIKDDEVYGIGTQLNLQKRNARDIITEGYYRMNEVKGCIQIEQMSFNAMIMFMDFKDNPSELNEKHFDMFQNKDYADIIKYLEESKLDGNEYYSILYHCLSQSRLFEILNLFSKIQDNQSDELKISVKVSTSK